MAAAMLYPPQYQHPALGQLTPPPSPGNAHEQPSKDHMLESVKYTANTGKLRRTRTPEPLILVNSNHEPYNKYLTFLADDNEHTPKANSLRPTPSRKSSNLTQSTEKVSPLSTDFEINGNVEVSRPVSMAVQPTSPSINTPDSKYSIVTPTIVRARSARQLPISAFSSAHTTRSNTIKESASRPELPKLITIPNHVQAKAPTLVKPNGITEKALPPPPPPPPPPVEPETQEVSPNRTIVPPIDPDTFPMPIDELKLQRNQPRVLRSVQSIGVLQSGPKTGDSSRTDFIRAYTMQTPRKHRRLFSGFGFINSSNKSQISRASTDSQSATPPNLTRRLSQLSKRKDSTITDPLAPVSILPVMTNREDVAGGLTYLPRYTNTFAGFCKSAWRLQLADPKSFDIRNRNASGKTPTLKCSKCTFEGPLHPQRVLGDRYIWAKIPDSKVYSSFGVSYTWQFLFKSHLALKKGSIPKTPISGPQKSAHIPPLPHARAPDVDMADGLFGCIFCCAAGLGTPVFKGPEALSWHLRSHANAVIHDQELQHRFKVIIGRKAREGEKFDVCIPQLDDSSDIVYGASVSVSVDGNGQWEEPGKISEEYSNGWRDNDRTAGPTSVNTPMLATRINSPEKTKRTAPWDIEKLPEMPLLKEISVDIVRS